MTGLNLTKNIEKMAHALLYAGQKSSTLGSTKMLKYLYISDVLHYNIFNTSIFNTSYLKFNHGPVADGAYPLVSSDNDYFTVIPKSGYGTTCQCIPKKNPDLSLFSKPQVTLFSGVFTAIEPFFAKTVSGVTHRFETWDNESPVILESDLLLTYDDREELNTIGISYHPFQNTLATTIASLSDNKGQAEEQLIQLIKKYPYTEAPEMENAYLAWDSVMRTCLKSEHTDLLPNLKEKGKCISCAASFKQNNKTPEDVKLEIYEENLFEIDSLLSRNRKTSTQKNTLATNIANSILDDIRTEYKQNRR